jgi:alkanesulfonate monooxygenase SsuD/methylene tetrahydromethanopterin reductase-like flavin-dependent oxidoreductase (luciferase family)
VSAVRFGVARPPRLSDDFVPWMEHAESVGASLFGFGDSQTMWPDPYVGLTLAAEHTERALIGPMVTTPVTRHPTTAASAIAAVQRLSRGRAFFGLGPGDSAAYSIGVPSVRMVEFEEYATCVRDLCAKHEAVYQGRELRMNWDTDPVPLWVAGDGPRMLELGGRIGDGVIVGNGATPELVAYARSHIAAGAAQSGRSIDDIDIWYMVRVHVTDTVEHGIEDLGFYLASYANVRFRRAMHDKGVTVTDDIAEKLNAFREAFDGRQAYDPGNRHNLDLLDQLGLTRWLADQFLVTGPLDLVVDRVRALVDAGARNIVIPQMLPDPIATTTRLAPVIASVA